MYRGPISFFMCMVFLLHLLGITITFKKGGRFVKNQFNWLPWGRVFSIILSLLFYILFLFVIPIIPWAYVRADPPPPQYLQLKDGEFANRLYTE